jgi:hypothetical protein
VRFYKHIITVQLFLCVVPTEPVLTNDRSFSRENSTEKLVSAGDDGTAMLTALTKCDAWSWCAEIEKFNATMTRYVKLSQIPSIFPEAVVLFVLSLSWQTIRQAQNNAGLCRESLDSERANGQTMSHPWVTTLNLNSIETG